MTKYQQLNKHIEKLKLYYQCLKKGEITSGLKYKMVKEYSKTNHLDNSIAHYFETVFDHQVQNHYSQTFKGNLKRLTIYAIFQL